MRDFAGVMRWYGGIPISDKVDDHVKFVGTCAGIVMVRYNHYKASQRMAPAEPVPAAYSAPPAHDTDLTASMHHAAPNGAVKANGAGTPAPPPVISDELLSAVVSEP